MKDETRDRKVRNKRGTHRVSNWGPYVAGNEMCAGPVPLSTSRNSVQSGD